MIPGEIDLPDLEAQLREDGVAFATDNPANDALEAHLQNSRAQAGLTDAGIVVVEQTPAQPADLRDIAHDLAEATGLETVIVRSPHASGAVSAAHTRAQVEGGQRAMMAQPDYGDGLKAFADTAGGGGPSWTIVAALALVTVLAVAIATVAATVRRADLT